MSDLSDRLRQLAAGTAVDPIWLATAADEIDRLATQLAKEQRHLERLAPRLAERDRLWTENARLRNELRDTRMTAQRLKTQLSHTQQSLIGARRRLEEGAA